MASVLNRTTKEYHPSVNTPDYPVGSWIHNPDVSAVAGFSTAYWKITGDTVSLMSVAERNAVDAAAIAASRDALAAQMDAIEDYNRAFALTCLDEFNAHATKINAILTAIDSGGTVAQIKTNILTVADYPQRTIAQLKTSLRNKLGT